MFEEDIYKQVEFYQPQLKSILVIGTIFKRLFYLKWLFRDAMFDWFLTLNIFLQLVVEINLLLQNDDKSLK